MSRRTARIVLVLGVVALAAFAWRRARAGTSFVEDVPTTNSDWLGQSSAGYSRDFLDTFFR